MSDVRGAESIGEYATSKSQREVIAVLRENGAVGHTKLCHELNIEWDELTGIIRVLRRKGIVVNRLDRRYELTA